MGKRIARDKRLLVANKMPPLHRTQLNEPYSYKHDEVLKWIATYPELLDYVFDKLSTGKHIRYNPDTGTWQGVNYGKD